MEARIWRRIEESYQSRDIICQYDLVSSLTLLQAITTWNLHLYLFPRLPRQNSRYSTTTSIMDFASLMAAEISKTKEKSTTTTTTEEATTVTTTATNKYLRRAEIESQRQNAYLEEQASLQRAREERARQKRKTEEEESTRTRAREEKRRRLAHESRIRREEEEATKERALRKRLGLPDLPPPSDANIKNGEAADRNGLPAAELGDMPDAELIALLRKLGEPAILFDESHRARLRRYRRLTSPTTPRPTFSATPIPTTLSLLPAHLSLVPSSLPPVSEREYLYRQLASYFTTVLTEWGVALAQRDEKVKESFQGKAAEMAMRQSRENMRPLFRRFERGDVEEGILEPVVEIVRAAQERRYVDANDGYLRLSIGKAYVPPPPLLFPFFYYYYSSFMLSFLFTKNHNTKRKKKTSTTQHYCTQTHSHAHTRLNNYRQEKKIKKFTGHGQSA